MHVLMLLAALSTSAEVTIDPSSLSEPPSQVEVALFAGNTRVKSFSTSTTFTLEPGAYRVTTGGHQLGRFKVNDAVSDVTGALTSSLGFDLGKLTKVNVDASPLASGAKLLVRVDDAIELTKPVTVFVPHGDFRVGAYGSFTVGADGVKSKSLVVTPRGITFDTSKYTRVYFAVGDLSSGGAKQVFTVKDVVRFEDDATVFFADDSYELSRLGRFTTRKGKVSVTGALEWDEGTHALRVDKKLLDRVSLDFTAFQRGMGSAEPLVLLDAQSTAPSARLIGSGAAYLPRGTYIVSAGEGGGPLGTFATSPVASTSGGVSWTITADPTLLVSLKLSSKREFHVAPFMRSRSTWQLSLPKGRYVLTAADGRTLTKLAVDPPRATLNSGDSGVSLVVAAP